jgi:hypothetical protein
MPHDPPNDTYLHAWLVALASGRAVKAKQTAIAQREIDARLLARSDAALGRSRALISAFHSSHWLELAPAPDEQDSQT